MVISKPTPTQTAIDNLARALVRRANALKRIHDRKEPNWVLNQDYSLACQDIAEARAELARIAPELTR